MDSSRWVSDVSNTCGGGEFDGCEGRIQPFLDDTLECVSEFIMLQKTCKARAAAKFSLVWFAACARFAPFFVTWWILTHIPGCHQETIESAPHSRRTHLHRMCLKRPRPVVTNPPNPPNFLTHACKRRPYRPWEWKQRKRRKMKTKTKTTRRRKG